MSACFVKRSELKYVVISSGEKHAQKSISKSHLKQRYDAEYTLQKDLLLLSLNILEKSGIGVACIPKSVVSEGRCHE